MKPMLDDLQLPLVQEVATHDRRALAEHKPPGMEGSFLQNMGRRPERVVLWGISTGPEARDFVEKLEEKFKAGQPASFTADISADSGIEKVVIDDLKWQELAGKPERYAYALILREHTEPVEPEDASLLDSDILDDAADIMKGLTEGLDILDKLSPFIGRLTKLSQALEREGVGAALQSAK
ncbi:MAG: hypothetical protein LUO89_07220 [Methanothrix sp.]|nr:hypothetical protein [Methanothrix sp.]